MAANAFAMIQKRAVRQEINQYDKSTVISIFPKLIVERKHTLQPGTFIIDPGTYENPSILVVTSSSWFRDVDEKMPLLEVPVHSATIAESVVRDYCNGMIECNMNDVMPGLFFIPTEVTKAELKTKYKALVDKANDKQNRWYNALIKQGDMLWARTNGNPLSISDDMKLAVKELGQNRDWVAAFQHAELKKCPACGTLVNPAYAICANCKTVINKEAAKALGLEIAKV